MKILNKLLSFTVSEANKLTTKQLATLLVELNEVELVEIPKSSNLYRRYFAESFTSDYPTWLWQTSFKGKRFRVHRENLSKYIQTRRI